MNITGKGFDGVEDMVRDMRSKFPQYVDEINDVLSGKSHWKDAASNVMDHALKRDEMLRKYGWNESNWNTDMNSTNQNEPQPPMRRRFLSGLFDVIKQASFKNMMRSHA